MGGENDVQCRQQDHRMIPPAHGLNASAADVV
jgi:hypothetical protein